MIHSFDIFDTLITRSTATPKGIFALMKDKIAAAKDDEGLDSFIIDNFYELRKNAEDLARRTAEAQNREEISLKDIYDAMALCGCISDEQREYLAKVEVNVELDNIRPIVSNISRVKSLMDMGERVILISDMYLSGEVIHRMLCKVDQELGELPLYVSSDLGVRKTTGNLYRKVAEIEGIGWDEWIHVGDNSYQDIEVPRQFGICVEHLERKKRTDLEEELLSKYEDDAGLQRMIGAIMRAEETQECENQDAYCMGSRYAAPLLYMYGQWIVKQALNRGIKRLYFIARDGYLVKKVVDEIIATKRKDISTFYLYGSRKAWRMVSLSDSQYNLYQLLIWSHRERITDLEKLAEVLEINVEDLFDYLPGIYCENREELSISYQELEYIARCLSKSEAFKAYHLRSLEEKRHLAKRYLMQQLDLSDDDFAFVDVSGGGLTQGCLRELIKEEYSKPIHTFFFKIDRVNLIKESITDTFFPSFMENNLVIEMMCRAPHGQTMGYKILAEKVVPALSGEEGTLIDRHGFNDYEKGIMIAVKYLLQEEIISNMRCESLKVVGYYLKYIAENPSKDVLEYFASVPSNETGRGNEIVEYAPRLSKEEIKRIFLGMSPWLPIELFYKGTNLNYSLLRASEEERELIEYCKREYSGDVGIAYRQDVEKEWQNLRDKYGLAAFYPIRLLEKQIILYGAGKLGQALYKKIQDYGAQEVVLWVDKEAERYSKKEGLPIREVSEVLNVECSQIVIAVAAKKTAQQIKQELMSMGIKEDRLFWVERLHLPNLRVKWESEEIG